MLNSSSFRWASFALALGLGVTGALAPLAPPVAQARSRDPVQLKLRQVDGRVDVLIAGLGPGGRVISQRLGGSSWSAQLDSSLLAEDRLLQGVADAFSGVGVDPSAPSDAGLASVNHDQTSRCRFRRFQPMGLT